MKENEIQVLGISSKRENRLKFWPLIIITIIIVLIIGVLIGRSANRNSQNSKCKLGKSTLDSCLQLSVDSILKENMTEICAMSGQAIIMEVATGDIRAMVGLQRRFDGEYEPCNNLKHQQESKLLKIASVLALLETGKYNLGEIIDTENGIAVFDGIVIKDHNWHRGGYGKITLEQAILYSSDIGICKPLWKEYKDKPQEFFDKLNYMGVGLPNNLDSVGDFKPAGGISVRDSIYENTDLLYQFYGYKRKLSPLQILTFYNAIANGGCMIKPRLFTGDTIVLRSQIADSIKIKDIQKLLRSVVIEGLGRKAGSNFIDVAGYMGTSDVRPYVDDYGDEISYKSEYNVQFCGYFPAQRPRYSIIVSMNKIGLPASGGGTAGPVFRQIVENMVNRGM